MSMLDFLGGAAQTGQGIIQQQMQQEDQLANAKSLAELNNELMIQRDDTVAKLREQRQQDAAQAVTAAANQARTARLLAAANDGDTDPLAQPSADTQPNQAVSVGDDRSVPLTPQQMEGITSGSITAAADQPTADMLNTPDIPARKVYTADDIAALTPAQIAKLGVRDDRATRMDDLASAAESMGHLDIAKDYRGQQQLELSRQAQEAAAKRAEASENYRWVAEQRKQQSDDERWYNESVKRDIAQQRADDNGNRIAALISRMGGGSPGDNTKQALSFVDGQRKELAQESSEVRSLMNTEISGANGNQKAIAEIKAAYQPKLDALDMRRRSIEADYGSLRERVGLPKLSAADNAMLDKARFAIAAGADPAKVKARLKSMNIDPAGL